MQLTSQLLMIRPVDFGFNAETAVNNTFQSPEGNETAQLNALTEFNNFVALLRKNKLSVTVIDDTPLPHTPDSIFPNNWISFDEDDSIILYPMFAENRRAERKQHILDIIKNDFWVHDEIDLTFFEKDDLFLEGTGSMVLDRENRIAYASLSPRTNKIVLDEFCNLKNYTAITFISVDLNNIEIYHTNVMMCVADKFVVICLDAIKNEMEKANVAISIQQSGKEIIQLSPQQINSFAGNMLQVINAEKERLLIMSTQAYNSLTPLQVEKLEKYNRILHSPLNTIEKAGGGSARCMLAEVFLSPK
jgi:hypothetical protein